MSGSRFASIVVLGLVGTGVVGWMALRGKQQPHFPGIGEITKVFESKGLWRIPGERREDFLGRPLTRIAYTNDADRTEREMCVYLDARKVVRAVVFEAIREGTARDERRWKGLRNHLIAELEFTNKAIEGMRDLIGLSLKEPGVQRMPSDWAMRKAKMETGGREDSHAELRQFYPQGLRCQLLEFHGVTPGRGDEVYAMEVRCFDQTWKDD